jgi:hypothetical protein
VARHSAAKATEAEAIDRKWKLHQELTIEKVLEEQQQQQHQPHQQQQRVANQHQQQDAEEEQHQPALEKHLNSEEHPNSHPNLTQPEDQTLIEDANAIEIARLRQLVLELQVCACVAGCALVCWIWKGNKWDCRGGLILFPELQPFGGS